MNRNPVRRNTGFSAPEKQTVEVLGDGSLVVNYYYTRNTGLLLLEVTGNPGGKEFAPIQDVPYGTPIGEIEEVVYRQNDREGYTFEGWYTDGNHMENGPRFPVSTAWNITSRIHPIRDPIPWWKKRQRQP